MRFLRAYHSYEIVGVEYIPRSGPMLVASSHSLATYENFLMGSAALDTFGRKPYILADDLLFRIPVVGTALREVGIVPGKRDAAMEILRRGDLLGLGPGGMRESLRGRRDKYTFDWTGRYGFVWVAMLTGAPIVLAACPAADDIYDVYDSSLTPKVYQKYHLPLPFFRGVGPTWVPRPVKLRHFVDKPIYSDVPPDQVTEEHVRAHHEYLVGRMHQLMAHAVEVCGLK